jgi:hypothetical protein
MNTTPAWIVELRARIDAEKAAEKAKKRAVKMARGDKSRKQQDTEAGKNARRFLRYHERKDWFAERLARDRD